MRIICRFIVVSVWALFIIITKSQAQCDDISKIEKTFYVSSSIGNDKNDGLTKRSPKQHISAIGQKENIHILLKRGDVFFEQIQGYTNCIIEDYGRGDKPVICGFKVLINTMAWENVGKQLWKLDLSKTSNFDGNIEKTPNKSFNNIGFIYNFLNDKIYGCNVSEVDLLKNEMDFYTTSFYPDTDMKQHSFTSIVVKSSSHPAELGHLCFSVCKTGITEMTNCIIRRIAISGFGKNGMSVLNNCIVDDCQIDLIGGSLLLTSNNWVRFGNGIELWYNDCNNIITNCLISRTYDCATTIQANGKINSNPHNNHFKNNRIYKCRQAFEHFLNPSNAFKAEYEDCDFSYNICYLMGDNEFNSPEARDCNILSYEKENRAISIKNNIFFGANHIFGTGITDGMTRNLVYIYSGQYLYLNHKVLTKIDASTEDNVKIGMYREIVPDNSKIVVLKRNSLRAKRIDRRIRSKVGWKKVDLKLERIIQRQ